MSLGSLATLHPGMEKGCVRREWFLSSSVDRRKETGMTRLIGIAVVLGAFFVVVGRAEEKVPLDKLPKAVVDSVKKRFPDAKLVSAEKEKDDNGKTVYEVAIKDKDQSIEVTLTPEGVIVEI